jgi:hypothetical protein
MTTSNQKTAYATTRQKYANAKYRDVKIGEDWLTKESQQKGSPGNNGDFVMVVDDQLMPYHNLRSAYKQEKCKNRYYDDARQNQ